MGRKRLFNDREKWCNKCSKWVLLTNFGTNRNRPSGRADYCKNCVNTNYHDGLSFSDYHRQHTYNLSPEAYEVLLVKQNRKCAICECSFRLCVDHNHQTGFIRGLLCRRCNMMLGHLNDDVTKLERAIKYLKAEFAPQV